MCAEVLPVHRRKYHRRAVLLLLLLMFLVNVSVRYPLDHAVPNGSDTFFMLDLARSLGREGDAHWILSPLSYIGLYPLSYSSGALFAYSEYHLLTGSSWNSVPWVFSIVFTLMLVLGGFMLFRAFHVRDELAAVFAGLMALSPFYLYFTFGQASARGFLMPVFILSLFLMFWATGSPWKRFVLFSALTFGALTIHRSSFVVVFCEGLGGLVLVLTPFITPKPHRLRLSIYVSAIVLGITMVAWPFVPGLRNVFQNIPEIAVTYRLAEWDFRSGFLFKGDAPVVLLANLITNYVGSIGLVILLFPAAIVALYPRSVITGAKDIFVITTFLVLSPLVWKAQYLQLILLPFFYLVAALTIQRRSRIITAMRSLVPSRVTLKRFRIRIPHLSVAAVFAFFLVCMMFSIVWFGHRTAFVEPYTDERNWPIDSEADLGIYLGAYDKEGVRAFVSVTGLLDRRVRWFSGWDSPVTDAAVLQANGYLNANSGDFTYNADAQGGYLDFVTSFYKLESFYTLNESIQNSSLYELSWGGVYGFFHLYFKNLTSAIVLPRVNASEAGISVVIEVTAIGNNVPNIYMGEGTIASGFLREISSSTYKLYQNDKYSAYLAASPSWEVG